MRVLRIAALLTADLPHLAAAGIGGLEDGTYDAFDCDLPVGDERFELSGDTLAFYESSCRLSNPQSLRDLPGAVLLDEDCMGKGQNWTERLIMMQTRDGGIAFMQEGWGGTILGASDRGTDEKDLSCRALSDRRGAGRQLQVNRQLMIRVHAQGNT